MNLIAEQNAKYTKKKSSYMAHLERFNLDVKTWSPEKESKREMGKSYK